MHDDEREEIRAATASPPGSAMLPGITMGDGDCERLWKDLLHETDVRGAGMIRREDRPAFQSLANRRPISLRSLRDKSCCSRLRTGIERAMYALQYARPLPLCSQSLNS